MSICLVLMVSCSSNRSATKSVQTSLKNSPAYQQGFVGFALYDPLKKEMLYEHNSERYFTPASNTKLFTYYAGLKILGDSIAGLRYTVKNDSLFFRGTGDPSFLYPDLPSSNVLDFLAGSASHLFYLPAVHTEKYFGPGWAWDWYNASYAVERSDFPIYGNRVTFNFSDNGPQPIPAFFQESIVVEKDNNLPFTSIRRDISKNEFTHYNPGGPRGRDQDIPFKYSPELMVELLSDTLHQEVKIHKGTTEMLPEKTLYSISADSMYKRMLVVSDNFIAEQILLMAANEISDSLKSSIAIDYMKENYLNDLPDEPMWYDGSGLAHINKFTPRSVVKLLEKIQQEVPQEKLFEMLAVGGVSGTIRNNYRGEEPYIFAKTGTIRNVHALSGFIKTKSGKILIFSLMNNNYTIPTSEVKTGMENLMETIRDKY